MSTVFTKSIFVRTDRENPLENEVFFFSMVTFVIRI